MVGLDRHDDTSSLLLHGSAVRLGDKGILLLGRSGRGKSDLALQMIDQGAVLIADDQVRIHREGDHLIAEAPSELSGLLEVRGVGIMHLPHTRSMLNLVVDLDLDKEETRLPDPMIACWCGLDLRKIQINPKAASAIAKIKIALHAKRAA